MTSNLTMATARAGRMTGPEVSDVGFFSNAAGGAQARCPRRRRPHHASHRDAEPRRAEAPPRCTPGGDRCDHGGARESVAPGVRSAEPELQDGDALPPGWHVLYFLPRFTPRDLRPDGAPAGSGVVPDMPLPRRMFAGQTLRFHRPLRIGQSVKQETELTDISAKSGGTGTLVFATVVSRISGPDGLALEDA